MRLLCLLLGAYQLVVLVHIIGSWVPAPPDGLRPVFRGAAAMVDPLVVPLRRVIPPIRIGGAALDGAILVLLLGLFLLRAVVC